MARINKFLNFLQKNPLLTKNGLRLLIPLICVLWVMQILNKNCFLWGDYWLVCNVGIAKIDMFWKRCNKNAKKFANVAPICYLCMRF